MRYQTTFSLLGKRGELKYLNAKERASFYKACQSLPLDRRLFCELLFFTGARISEIYELTVDRVDLSDRTVILRTLKQRRNNVYRQIHIPDHLIEALTAYIAQCKAKTLIKSDEDTLWNFSLRTGYRAVKNVNAKVDIYGAKSSPKGLRHGFAVHAVRKIPVTQVQLCMGHADLKTTAIYLNVSGLEERQMMEALW